MTKRMLIVILGATLGAFGCDDNGGSDAGPGPVDAGGGTDGGGTDGGGTDGGGTDGGGGGGPTCADYCTTFASNCSTQSVAYTDDAECMSICEAFGWAAGDAVTVSGPLDGNTIGCRTYHGGSPAGEDPVLHCPHASYAGGDTCGDWCEVYCTAALSVCTGGDAIYGDMAECMTACAPLDDTAAIGVTDGDTVQCRLYHLSVAVIENDRATHCPHAGADGAGVCVGGWDFRTDTASAYTRVDHAGMPAVPTVLAATITSAGDLSARNAVRDMYNDLAPDTSSLVGGANGIGANLTALHSVLSDDLVIDAGLVTCATYSTPPSGTAGSSTAGVADDVSACVTQVQTIAGVVPDVLSVDRTGTIGFPNGRDLPNPVIDITLAAILLDLSAAGQTATSLVGVNPTMNDLDFLATFPYLAAPHAPAP
ncbi:MAG: DUF4331 family protein [Sandaracinaceae bacterium]|nr:DUF4331 family protein [Sandaracinaceae bacterium]